MLTPSAVSLIYKTKTFTVLSLKGIEALSQPFQFIVTFDWHFECSVREMSGMPATIQILDAQGNRRHISGCIRAIRDSYDKLELTIEPRLAFGQYSRNTRLFLGKTRPEIIQQILRELGYDKSQIHWHCRVNDNHLSPTLLQANETHLAFVQRLLAELGCIYWFTSDGIFEQLHIGNSLVQTPYTPELTSPEAARKAALNGEPRPLASIASLPKPPKNRLYALRAKSMSGEATDDLAHRQCSGLMILYSLKG